MRFCAGVVLLSILVAFEASAGEKMAQPTLDLAVKVTPNPANTLRGTTQAYDDVLAVRAGRLSSKVSSGYGFPDGPYTAKNEAGKTLIQAELKDEKHGLNQYNLVIQGEKVTGTLKWSKTGEDGKPKSAEYTLAGTVKR
jgi:hypothetical protein